MTLTVLKNEYSKNEKRSYRSELQVWCRACWSDIQRFVSQTSINNRHKAYQRWRVPWKGWSPWWGDRNFDLKAEQTHFEHGVLLDVLFAAVKHIRNISAFNRGLRILSLRVDEDIKGYRSSRILDHMLFFIPVFEVSHTSGSKICKSGVQSSW